LPEAQSAAVVQTTGQEALDPAQRYGAQVGAPEVPFARTVQVPFADAPSAAEQTSHEPLQPASQQKPSTQLPDEHSPAPPQAEPFVFLVTQLEPLQKFPDAQSVEVVHDAPQLALPPVQRYGAHDGEPELPDESTVQVPLAEAPSAAEQTSQEPLQAVPQQKPSTQLPELHWFAAVQAEPVAFFATQLDPLQ
jgi:hypothetical protein